MPQNTTASNPGTPVEFQNPAAPSLVLDSEVSGTDSVSGTQLTREFVVPQDSIAGASSSEKVTELLAQLLVELRKIRILMELEATPGQADELEEASLSSDESDQEEG